MIEDIKGSVDEILKCEQKDENGLNDFQKLPSTINIEIPKVGIERFRIPLRFEHTDLGPLTHDVEASMFVKLEGKKNGVNMSRFCKLILNKSFKNSVGSSFIKELLREMRTELRDFESEPLLPRADLKLDFSYPMKQKSLRTDNWGIQYYKVSLSAFENDLGELVSKVIVGYEYSSTCPCSLSMAKQYEDDFKDGKVTEGTGIATAHSQRSLATVEVSYDLNSDFFIEDLIKLLRIAIPTETQVVVKRDDEQAFAILNGEYPMFVEHVARRLAVAFSDKPEILDWNARIEHFESLHSHNAVAYINKQ